MNWKIVNKEDVAGIVGKIIAQFPDNDDRYEVKSVNNRYVLAVGADGQTKIKMFPEERLLNDRWWCIVKDAN